MKKSRGVVSKKLDTPNLWFVIVITTLFSILTIWFIVQNFSEELNLSPRLALGSDSLKERTVEREVVSEFSKESFDGLKTSGKVLFPAVSEMEDKNIFSLVVDGKEIFVDSSIHRKLEGNRDYFYGSFGDEGYIAFLIDEDSDIISGNIWLSEGEYQFHSNDFGNEKSSGISYAQLLANMRDEVLLPEGLTIEAIQQAAGGTASQIDFEIANRTSDGRVYFDLMYLYIEEASEDWGGDAALENLIQLSVENMNTALENSNVSAEARAVHVYKSDYDYFGTGVCDGESWCSIGETLGLVFSDNEGVLDEVHEKRTRYGADSVIFVSGSMPIAIAYLLNPHVPESERRGFLYVPANGLSGLTVAHEVGHNLGCVHDRRYPQFVPPAYPFAWGYNFTGSTGHWRTVMAYSGGPKISHYSNPDILYNGTPTGISHDVDPLNSADCAQNIQLVRKDYSKFRGCRVNCSMEAVTNLAAIGENPGEIKVTFEKSQQPSLTNHTIYRDKHCLAKPVFRVGPDTEEFIDDNFISPGEEYCYSVSYETARGNEGPCSAYSCVQASSDTNLAVEIGNNSFENLNLVERWRTQDELWSTVHNGRNPLTVLGNSNKLFFYDSGATEFWAGEDEFDNAILLDSDEDFNEPLKRWEYSTPDTSIGSIKMVDIAAAKNSDVYVYAMRKPYVDFGTVAVFNDSELVWEFTENNMAMSNSSHLDRFLVDVSSDGRYIAVAYDTSYVDGNGYLMIFDNQNIDVNNPQPIVRKSLVDFGFDEWCNTWVCIDDNLRGMEMSGDGTTIALFFDVADFMADDFLIYDVTLDSNVTRKTLEFNSPFIDDENLLSISQDGAKIVGCNENKIFFMNSANNYQMGEVLMQNEIGGFVECHGVEISEDGSTLAYAGKETVGSVSVKNIGAVDLNAMQFLLTDSIEFGEESLAEDPYEFVKIDMSGDGKTIVFGSDGDEAKIMPEVLVYHVGHPEGPIAFKKLDQLIADPTYRVTAIPFINPSGDRIYVYSLWGDDTTIKHKEIIRYDLAGGNRIIRVPQNVIASEEGYDGGIHVSWKKSAFNDQSYTIYRTTDPSRPGCDSPSDVLTTVGSGVFEHDDYSVEKNKTYYYSVRTSNDGGGGCSLINSGIFMEERNAVRNLEASDGDDNYARSIYLTWDESFYGNEVSYEIFKENYHQWKRCEGESIVNLSSGTLSYLDHSVNDSVFFNSLTGYSIRTYVPGEGTFCSDFDVGRWNEWG